MRHNFPQSFSGQKGRLQNFQIQILVENTQGETFYCVSLFDATILCSLQVQSFHYHLREQIFYTNMGTKYNFRVSSYLHLNNNRMNETLNISTCKVEPIKELVLPPKCLLIKTRVEKLTALVLGHLRILLCMVAISNHLIDRKDCFP